jgi:hypothetical protein
LAFRASLTQRRIHLRYVLLSKISLVALNFSMRWTSLRRPTSQQSLSRYPQPSQSIS